MPLDTEIYLKELLAFYGFLPRARRWQLQLTLALMLAGAACEMLTIGAVLPVLALVAAPESGIISSEVLIWLSWLGGSAIAGAALLLVVSALAGAGVRLLLSWTTQKFAMLAGSDLAVAIFARKLHLPYADQIRQNSSRTLTDVMDVQRVVNGVLLPAVQAVTAVVIALFITALLFLIHASAALTGAAVIGLSYLVFTFLTAPALRRNAKAISETATQRTRIVQEALGGIRDVILDRSHAAVEARFRSVDARHRRANAVNAFLASSARFPIEAAGLSALAVVAVLMSLKPGGVATAIPVLGALGLGAQRLLPLVQQTYWGWSQAAGNFHALSSVMETLKTPLPPQPAPASAADRFEFQRLELDSVSFRHADGSFTLKDISIAIHKGEHLGIVGPSGSGKSTLLDLLIGLLQPDEGAILINGRPLNATLLPIWQAALAHVPQSIFLADDSIAANIAFPRPVAELNADRLQQAIEAAALAPFLATLPDGLMTRVGERGVRLSAGQRQRIGVARALVRSPSVLILDEATSALDEGTEAQILSAVSAIPGLTMITVAHRASALARCRSWLHLEDGSAVTAQPSGSSPVQKLRPSGKTAASAQASAGRRGGR